MPLTTATDHYLLSARAKADQQVLALIETQTRQALQRLLPAEQLDYLRLCREEPQARTALANALAALKSQANALARQALGEALALKAGRPVDIDSALFSTTITEIEPQALDGSRSRERTRVERKSLWEAARNNFGFHQGSRWPLGSGQAFVDASRLIEPGQNAALSAQAFIDVVRDVDLGEQVLRFIEAEFTPQLRGALMAHREQTLRLDALEALRSGVIEREEYQALNRDIGDNRVQWSSHCANLGGTLLRLPLYVRQYPQLTGAPTFSYFPGRPDGALRKHHSPTGALADFQAQLTDQLQHGDSSWCMRPLSVRNQVRLQQFLNVPAVDKQQLNPLAKVLYNLFADKRPNAQRITFEAEGADAQHSLLDAYTSKSAEVFYADLIGDFTPTSDIDHQTWVKGLQQIASEVLELLLIPAPGGVTGLNALMLTASLGTLAYQSVLASQTLSRGQSAEFVQAMSDILDLVISLALQGQGARLSARRTRQLVSGLGDPRTTLGAAGETALSWSKPAKDAPETDLLNDAERLQTLLHPSLPAFDTRTGQRLMTLADVGRSALENIDRHAAPTPWQLVNVLEGERLRVELDQLGNALSSHAATLPAIAERVLPALAAQQLQVPIALYASDRQTLISLHAPESPQRPEVKVVRLSADHYETYAGGTPSADRSLLGALLAEYEQLNSNSTLGRSGDFTRDATFEGRLLNLQQDAARALGAHQAALYAALYDGRPRAQLASTDAGLAFAPSGAAADAPQHLLRQRFPELSAAAAAQLIEQQPGLQAISRDSQLTPAEIAAVLQVQAQSRCIDGLAALADPQGRGLNDDSEALFCHLLTTQPGWPESLGIQVYQGGRQPGGFYRSSQLLRGYGAETASTFVELVKVENGVYFGNDTRNDTLQPPYPGENGLISALLCTLDDAQRKALGLDIHDSALLGERIIREGSGLSADVRAELLPATTQVALSRTRLAHFRLTLALDGVEADAQGIYNVEGRLYIRHDGAVFQVLMDLEASTPAQPVWRIVHPGDAVAQDADNHFVATRPGRSEPVLRDASGAWVGAIVGIAGGMRPGTSRAVRQEQARMSQLELAQEEVLATREDIIRVNNLLVNLTRQREPAPENRQLGDLYAKATEKLIQLLDAKVAKLEEHDKILRTLSIYRSDIKPDYEKSLIRLLECVKDRVVWSDFVHETQIKALGKMDPAGNLATFRRHCHLYLDMLEFKYPYILKSTELKKKFDASLSSDSPLEIRQWVQEFTGQHLTPEHFIRSAQVFFRCCLLSVGDLLDPDGPGLYHREIAEFSTQARDATITLFDLDTLPDERAIPLLDTLQRQFESLGAQCRNLHEDFSNPRDIAHLQELARLMASFEADATARLNKRFEPLADVQPSRTEDTIDYDFIPAQHMPGAVAPKPHKVITVHRRRVKTPVSGTVRDNDADVIDVISDEGSQTVHSYRKQADGTWAPIDAPASQRPLLAVAEHAARSLGEETGWLARAEQMQREKYLPIDSVEYLQKRTDELLGLARELREQDAEHALIAQLDAAGARLEQHGQRIRIEAYKNPQVLNAHHLRVLMAQGEVTVAQLGARRQRGSGKKKHFLDVYEISDSKNGAALWQAHFHYRQQNSALTDYPLKGGHLKTLEQAHQGAEYQAGQEREGRKITPIWRETLDQDTASKLFALAESQ